MPITTIINNIRALSLAEQLFILEQTYRFVQENEQAQLHSNIESNYMQNTIAENYSANDFIEEWAGKFAGGEEDSDDVRYEYLINKYK